MTVTLSNFVQPPANATAPSPGASATRRLLATRRRLLSNPAPVLEGLTKAGGDDSASKEIWSGDPILVRSSFYIVNFCGYAPAITKEVRELRVRPR